MSVRLGLRVRRRSSPEREELWRAVTARDHVKRRQAYLMRLSRRFLPPDSVAPRIGVPSGGARGTTMLDALVDRSSDRPRSYPTRLNRNDAMRWRGASNTPSRSAPYRMTQLRRSLPATEPSTVSTSAQWSSSPLGSATPRASPTQPSMWNPATSALPRRPTHSMTGERRLPAPIATTRGAFATMNVRKTIASVPVRSQGASGTQNTGRQYPAAGDRAGVSFAPGPHPAKVDMDTWSSQLPQPVRDADGAENVGQGNHSEDRAVGDLLLDGAVLGQWIERHLERSIMQSNRGPSAIDTRVIPQWGVARVGY